LFGNNQELCPINAWATWWTYVDNFIVKVGHTKNNCNFFAYHKHTEEWTDQSHHKSCNYNKTALVIRFIYDMLPAYIFNIEFCYKKMFDVHTINNIANENIITEYSWC